MLQGFLKNGIAVFGYQIITRGLSFLSFVLVARILGVQEIGDFAYIISLCALLTLFVEFGTNQFLVKRTAAGNSSTTDIANIIALKIVQFIAGIALLSLLEYRILIKEFNILNITLGYVIFEGMIQVGISVLNGRKDFIKANRLLFFYETSRSVLLLTCLLITRDIFLVPFVYIGVAALFAIVIIKKISGRHFSFGAFRKFLSGLSFKTFLPYYRHTYIFFISAIAYQLYFRIDLILLKRLSTPFELGIYSTAYKFFEVFLFIPAILSGIAFPYIASFYAKNELTAMTDFLKEVQVKAVAAISFIILAIITCSDLIISVFFDQEYAASAHIMQLLFLTSFLYAFNFVYPILFNATGHERYPLYIFLIGFSLNYLLNYFLLPQYGARAAAIITLFSESIVTALYYWFARKSNMKVIHPRALMLLICAIILGWVRIAGIEGLNKVELSVVVLGTFVTIVLVFCRDSIRLNFAKHAGR